MTTFCNTCSLQIANNSFEKHVLTKKHLRKSEMERSICITPLPKTVKGTRLINFFRNFGTIDRCQFTTNAVLIVFRNRQSVDSLLPGPVFMENVNIQIMEGIKFNGTRKAKNSCESDPIAYDKIKHMFNQEVTFDDQLTAFLNTVQLSDIEIQERYECVCTNLEMIFKGIFPHCQVYKYGSIETGLGFKGCDLDIFMDIGQPICESRNHESPNSRTLPEVFAKVKKIMYKRVTIFSNVFAIPKAKMPIIKFFHVPTYISCDISFKNAFGLHKSALMKYYISLDQRIKPLMMLIKYWAKHFKLVRQGQITNYGLVMLIIFYLQQTSVNILPPLMYLQQTCLPIIVNGWQVNFDKNAILPPVTNMDSIPQLLRGFFSFYATFDFQTYVMCPLDGQAHKRCEFIETNSLPANMQGYKQNLMTESGPKKGRRNAHIGGPLCIQDPIELTSNITAGITSGKLESFVVHCKTACTVCERTCNNLPNQLMSKLLVTPLQKGSPKNMFSIGIDMHDDADTGKTAYSKENWYFNAFTVLKDTLVRVLKMDVKLNINDTEIKQEEMETISSTLLLKNCNNIVLSCTDKRCMWRYEKIFSIGKADSFEEAVALSDKAVETLKKTTFMNEMINFICTFTTVEHPTQLIVSFANRECPLSVFQELKGFITGKLCKIILKTLKSHSRNQNSVTKRGNVSM